MEDFIGCLQRLQSFFKKESIQATFCDVPPSVRLQTLDLVELSIKFWKAPDGMFCVDIQKCAGDNFKFHHMMRRIVDVITGVVDKPATDDAENPAAAIDYTKILEMYGVVLENVSPTTPPPPVMDSTKHTERIIVMVHAQLKSGSFSRRGSALETLTQATDILCTIASHAREVALIVLTGKAPEKLSESLNQQCLEIQEVLLHVLVTREFAGDEAWRNAVFGKEPEPVPSEKESMEITRHPFKKTRTDFQGQYESVMMASIHKVLTILCNSLEALKTDNYDAEFMDSVISSFLSRCHYVAKEKSLVSVLAALIVDGLKQCMAVAYLACHVLRLLSELYAPLIKDLGEESIRECVDKAYKTGQICHSRLEKESGLLIRNMRLLGSSGEIMA